MLHRNPYIAKLEENYLFEEVSRRVKTFREGFPEAKFCNLGIGDTTLPLAPTIGKALKDAAEVFVTKEGYEGYGPIEGKGELRQAIVERFYASHEISPEEIFISDGAKCDIARLQLLLGKGVSIALQDPTYPVYLEGSFLQGVHDVTYLPCSPDNGFFSLPSKDSRGIGGNNNSFKNGAAHILYFCSPNNPTGMAYTYDQLKKLVDFAREHQVLIIFDAAYGEFIRDPSLPKSIFAIPGAREVAIEVHSLSKTAGFTGLRLGWTVVPKELRFSDGSSIWKDWKRVLSTTFNGASLLSQRGALSALSDRGWKEVQGQISDYMTQAKKLKSALENLSEGEGKKYEVFGGDNAPYLWVCGSRKKKREHEEEAVGEGAHAKSSWELFSHFLEKFHLITTPGGGFGKQGEGFVRFSALGRGEEIDLACLRLSKEDSR